MSSGENLYLGGLGFAGLRRRRAMNSFANALIGAAAANVAAHEVVDVLIRRSGFLGQQSHGGHDLSRLAIAALRDVFCDPGLLHGVRAISREAFNGGDLL